MSIVSVQPKSFILALFIRDDNERFLLGDNGYDFKDSQLHFAANTIENDEVQKQGADGVMIAGQVRRASVQSFDGFVGDATMAKETIEQMRRDFIAFFLKGHHYRVIYVDCNRNAWQRKGGYLVDAPEVKELWQIHPEYHVGLNFEDVNYYSYDEDADGNEILANLVNVPVSTEIEGGLVWDEDGAVSEEAGDISYDEETADATPAKNVYITDATEAPLASFQLDGETSQNGTPTPSAPVAVNTTTGENVVKICGNNLFDETAAEMTVGILRSDGATAPQSNRLHTKGYIPVSPNTTYTLNADSDTSSKTIQAYVVAYSESGSTAAIANYPSNAWYNFPITFTTGENCNFIRISYHYTDNSDMNVGSAQNQQLELGSTATAYEPYQGQSYEVNLGKNLFDGGNADYVGGDAWEEYGNPSYLVIDNGYKFENRYRAIAFEFDNLVVGQQYVVSFDVIGNHPFTAGVGVNVYNRQTGGSSKTYNGSTASQRISFTFTATANNRIAFNSGTTADTEMEITNIQLEKGSQATSYAAYFEPIELCKIGDYQDYIYKDGSEWKIHKAVGKAVLDGSVAPTATNTDATNTIRPRWESFLSPAPNSPAADRLLAKSNRFQTVSNWSADVEGIYYDEGSSGQVWLRISKTLASNQTQVVSWLKSNPVYLYYPLGSTSQTDTAITNAALITQLGNVASAPLYTGVNNITTITPNEQGTLEISYYTKYQPMIGSGGYVWEAGGAGGPTVIINNSIDNVSPVWTIYGPTTNPQLENATTGETIEYVGTIAQGQTLTIDMGEQTASLDGLNVISNLVGDFIQLAPGRNNMIYSVSGEAGASELGWSEIVG